MTQVADIWTVPDHFRDKWKGVDLTDCDTIDYEFHPNELNQCYCKQCRRVFFLHYDSDNHNRFASKFCTPGEMQILWNDRCTWCTNEANKLTQWCELGGMFINWNQACYWDDIPLVITTKFSKLQFFDKSFTNYICVQIFLFLAQLGECWPAQNSQDIASYQQQWRKPRMDVLTECKRWCNTKDTQLKLTDIYPKRQLTDIYPKRKREKTPKELEEESKWTKRRAEIVKIRQSRMQMKSILTSTSMIPT